MALEPITRQEKIIAGQDLTPITRMEKFLKEFGGSGGGGIPVPETAEVGQTIVVKAVDENGKPTEWECADFPEGGSGGETVQSDWNQYDETAPDFIKNKPFGDFLTVILEEQELPYDAEMAGCVGIASHPIEDGDELWVGYDGVGYSCLATAFDGVGVVFGNMSLIGLDDTGEPFVGVYVEGAVQITPLDEANHTVEITAVSTVKIPGKYAPVTKLYVSSDKYIYTDQMCTIKATKEEVPDNNDFSIGVAEFGIVKRWIPPTVVDSMSQGILSGYRSVSFVDSTSGKVTHYYTAEYTG